MKIVSVIGMGTMGPGIAATLARGGMTVRCYDTSAEALANSAGLISGAFGVLDALGMPDNGGPEQISMSDSLEDCVAGADLVVETVPEVLELKLELLGKLDGLVSPECVLASDTSGLPITRLQEGNSNPGRVIGMHWSNPPHIIPIIEVVAGDGRADGRHHSPDQPAAHSGQERRSGVCREPGSLCHYAGVRGSR